MVMKNRNENVEENQWHQPRIPAPRRERKYQLKREKRRNEIIESHINRNEKWKCKQASAAIKMYDQPHVIIEMATVIEKKKKKNRRRNERNEENLHVWNNVENGIDSARNQKMSAKLTRKMIIGALYIEKYRSIINNRKMISWRRSRKIEITQSRENHTKRATHIRREIIESTIIEMKKEAQRRKSIEGVKSPAPLRPLGIRERNEKCFIEKAKSENKMKSLRAEK